MIMFQPLILKYNTRLQYNVVNLKDVKLIELQDCNTFKS
ncbi:hypothetical protein SCAPIOD70007 [Staphylococcus capitis]|nr:hypothetical protein CR01_100105 [Staphylococcus capitis CR01]CQD29594.1 hypothetical protein SCAPIOD70007 [Staphylococcus capitis]CQD29822.1 hypothetical protein SCAPIOD80007 [Staphylococcus capitis]CQD30941.1 hypothetical protein SCAPIOD130007 [Staphylococcus capitis]CRN12406.1 hypothetical protein BN151780104 [Staphylococcus capitis]